MMIWRNLSPATLADVLERLVGRRSSRPLAGPATPPHAASVAPGDPATGYAGAPASDRRPAALVRHSRWSVRAKHD
jgi:hypothetical protein